MNEHDQDCDGHCGWNRTLCNEQWRAFLQLVQNDDPYGPDMELDRESNLLNP